jgi:hypothetical protein
MRNIDGATTWRLRNLVALALKSLTQVPMGPARDLARCAVLRTAQWALDMRDELPTAEEFRETLAENVEDMVDAAVVFTAAARQADGDMPDGVSDHTTVVARGLPGLKDDPVVTAAPAPRLILTSPPYPGVYVLYHRWKVQGRRETPAPYWVANCRDGSGMAHYMFGERRDPTLSRYYERLLEGFTELASLSSARTRVVQMVGFKAPAADLPLYLNTMEQAGWVEEQFPELATAPDGRLWRVVPGRRWWNTADALKEPRTNTSREVVFVHRLA